MRIEYAPIGIERNDKLDSYGLEPVVDLSATGFLRD